MEYLDPEKKRKHRMRIMFGYGLFAVAISMATVLMVYIANGYYVDRSTGEVIQNGLVYVDTRPVSAEVTIDGELQNVRTDSRHVIPSGTHTFDLFAEGYRPWSRTFNLEGGSLRRLTYARLIPDVLTPELATNLRQNPINSSQSINKRWIIMSYESNPLDLTLIDIDNPQSVINQTLTLPDELVTDPETGIVEFMEWDASDRYILATYTVANNPEYIMIDREQPNNSFNLSKELNPRMQFVMRDRDVNAYFAYDPVSRELFKANRNSIETESILKDVIQYEVFGEDWVVYLTESEEASMVQARLLRGDQNIQLKNLQVSDRYFLEIARLGNAPIIGVASAVEDRVIVYFDPEKYLRENPDSTLPVATTVMRIPSLIDFSISSDSSVILGYGSDNIAAHEFNEDRSYNYKLDRPIDAGQEVRWIEGQHITYISEGVAYISDFDGSNVYDLVPSTPLLGVYGTDSVEELISFAAGVYDTDGNATVPPRVNVTSLVVSTN